MIFGLHCVAFIVLPPSKPQTLAIFPLVHCTPPPPGLCTPGPGKLVRKRGGYIGSLSIPSEQKVNDGRFSAVDREKRKKSLWNRKLLAKGTTWHKMKSLSECTIYLVWLSFHALLSGITLCRFMSKTSGRINVRQAKSKSRFGFSHSKMKWLKFAQHFSLLVLLFSLW